MHIQPKISGPAKTFLAKKSGPAVPPTTALS